MQRRLLSKILYIPIICIGSFLLSNKCNAASSATLTLGNGSNSTQSLSTTVTQGDIAYLSSTIKVDAVDIENYTLSITGPVGLSSNGGSTITGAGGNTPANMANNSWGYSYNNSNSNENKTYYSFTGSNQQLETGTTPSGQAKNITFAAKFASNATSTHYTAQVTVNLVATPKKLIFDGITKMQEMTSTICNNATVGDTATLTDSRDSKPYSIRKHEDNKCWMTQNLAIIDKTISSSDSDMTSGSFTVPASNISGITSENNSTAQAYLGTSSDGTEADGTGYYNHYTATAGTGTPFTNGDNAVSSICPKGWRLPTGRVVGNNTTNDFYNLFNSMDNSIFANDLHADGYPTYWASPASDNLAKITGSPYNFNLAGSIYNGLLDYVSSSSHWRSSTASGSSGDSYSLSISSTYVIAGTAADGRYFGYPVRCLAR